MISRVLLLSIYKHSTHECGRSTGSTQYLREDHDTLPSRRNATSVLQVFRPSGDRNHRATRGKFSSHGGYRSELSVGSLILKTAMASALQVRGQYYELRACTSTSADGSFGRGKLHFSGAARCEVQETQHIYRGCGRVSCWDDVWRASR